MSIHKILNAWEESLELFGRKEVIQPVTVGPETRLCMGYAPCPREMVELAAIMQICLVKLGLDEIATRFHAEESDVLPFLRAYGIENSVDVVAIPGVNGGPNRFPCPKLTIHVRGEHVISAINGTLSLKISVLMRLVGHDRADVVVIAVDDACEVAMCTLATRLRFRHQYSVISVILPGASSAECIEYAREIPARMLYIVTPEHWATNMVECLEL